MFYSKSATIAVASIALVVLGTDEGLADSERFGGVSQGRSGEPARADAGSTGDIPDRWRNAQPVEVYSDIDPEAVQRSLRAAGPDRYADGFGAASPAQEYNAVEPGDELRQAAGRAFKAMTEAGPDGTRSEGWRLVIGDDERIPIETTDRYPFRAIGFLLSDYGETQGRCTATLIGPQWLLTAAHCVYDRETGTWAQQMLFVPGLNSDGAPFGVVETGSPIVPTGYVEADGETGLPPMAFDMAVVPLQVPAGDSVGWMSYGFQDPAVDFIGNIVGYPADLGADTMWRASCPFEASRLFINGLIFEHQCDTYGGMSGSGAYDYDRNADSRVILGVHVAGSDTSNFAVRISEAHFQWINQFVWP